MLLIFACAPTLDDVPLELLTCELPRVHEATLEPDGIKVRVRGLPLFATTREEDGRDERDADWLATAKGRFEARAEAGYWPPMHFKHHGTHGIPTDAAGHFELTEIRDGEVNPNDVRPVLFGDLVFRDAATFERWRAEFPHRSVEISPDYPDEINSLALLDDEAPYFRFPIPTVRKSFAARGEHREATIQVWRATMADKDEKEPAAGAPPGGADKNAAAPPPVADQDAAATTDPVMAKLDALAKQHEEIIGLLKKLGSGGGAEQNAAYRGTPETPVIETGGHAAECDKPKGAPVVMSAESAQYSASILGLQEKVANLTREREVDLMLVTAKDAFSAARARGGRPAPTNDEIANVRKTLVTGGKPALDLFLAGLGEVRAQTAAFQAVGTAAPADDTKIPASLQPFIARGGDEAKRARAIAAAYAAGQFRSFKTTEADLPNMVTMKALRPNEPVPFNARKGG